MRAASLIAIQAWLIVICWKKYGLLRIRKISSFIQDRKQRLTTAKLIGRVAAIVAKVAERSAVDALFVGASVLVYGIAETNSRCAHRHIVLVGSVAAVVDTVA